MASRLPLHRRPDQVFFLFATRLHSKFIKIVNQRLISWDKVRKGSAKPVAFIRSPSYSLPSGLMYVALSRAKSFQRAFDLNPFDLGRYNCIDKGQYVEARREEFRCLRLTPTATANSANLAPNVPYCVG